jgi:2,4-dienoyl-CoA reductase-like NADH-dependent reductase (Old Yellow Enzyme family)
MVMAEATAVTPEGRITEHDLGLWSEAHVGPHARLTAAIAATGALPAIQLAHAGRKAARLPAWLSGPAAHPWPALAPSALAFGNYETPRAMTEGEIGATLEAFVATAQRAARAGYRLVELHAAHGYLLHSFLSPLSNRRNDAWGGDFEGRTRLLRDIAAASRAALPREVALVVRVSHTDWVAGGWTTEESVELARRLKALGVDAVDVSSGGVDPAQKIPLGPGYQVPGAAAIREGAGLPVFAVGLITEAAHAESILAAGQADLILLARALLRDPYWPLRAAEALGATAALPTPPQYERGWAGAAPLALRAETGLPRPALA